VSLLAIFLNLVINFILVKGLQLGHVGLAATTGMLALINFAQLAFYLGRQVRCGSASRWLRLAGSVGAAALCCGWSAGRAAHWAAAALPGGFMGRVLSLSAGLAGGIVAYGLATSLLRVPETVSAWGLIRKRFVRVRPPAA
jgi:putative peptidoglycan lipid II flippase